MSSSGWPIKALLGSCESFLRRAIDRIWNNDNEFSICHDPSGFTIIIAMIISRPIGGQETRQGEQNLYTWFNKLFTLHISRRSGELLRCLNLKSQSSLWLWSVDQKSPVIRPDYIGNVVAVHLVCCNSVLC